uniref:Uncharacterized protein n=1 Tax=Arundo donax TaxID=35708 RepID=A0A0A9FUP8_ARUDO
MCLFFILLNLTMKQILCLHYPTLNCGGQSCGLCTYLQSGKSESVLSHFLGYFVFL